LLVNPADPIALAQALRTLLSDAELRRRFAAAGRARVVHEFAAVDMVRHVEELYDEVLTSRECSAGRYQYAA
jgi:glycosyltransferase involved in cell wall biosynthesis